MINKSKYTLLQVEDIIDNYLQNSQNFMFVCDFAMAHYIYDYIHNDYGIVAECLELASDVDEYYVSMQFYDDGDMVLVCEFAKGNDGTYKYDEVDDIHYFVFSDMAFGDVREFLLGKGGLLFCELVGDGYVEEEDLDDTDELLDGEEHYQDCKCSDCTNKCKQDELDELFGQAFQKIMEADNCPKCIFESMREFGSGMMDFGWKEHWEYINEMNNKSG